MLDANLRANGAAAVETRARGDLDVDRHADLSVRGQRLGDDRIAAGRGRRARRPTVPSLRLRDLLEEGPVDLLKLDIEGAEDVVLADCEPVLHRVKAIVMDLHEFDPAARQAPRVLERLTRAGFTYAIDDFVAAAVARAERRPPIRRFPARRMQWAMTVRAWRDR